MSIVKSLLLSFIVIFLYAGCSSKSQASLEKIEKNKAESLKAKIEISDKTSDGFLAYINDDNELTYLCSTKSTDSCSYQRDLDEEDYFWISSSGYRPSINSETSGITCGAGSMFGWVAIFMDEPLGITDHTEANAKVCKHRFVELDSTLIPGRIIVGMMTFGTSLVTGGTMHTKKFDKESFKEAVFETNVESFKKQLLDIDAKYKNLDGFDVIYLQRDRVQESLEDKYKYLLKESSKKSGVVFLEKNSNKLLWMGVFDEYRDRDLISSISMQIEDLLKGVQTGDKYRLELEDIVEYIPAQIPLPKLPVVPKIVKDEFETNSNFKKRVQKAVEHREMHIRELQRKYSFEVSKRNSYVKELQDSYKQYREQYAKDKDLLVNSLSKNIDLLSKILFLQNTSGYSAKEFKYDAEAQKMYFKIYSLKENFNQEVVAVIPPKIAKEIKLESSFKIIPQIQADQNKIKLLGFNIVEVGSKKSFETKYTNINFNPKEVSVRVVLEDESLKEELSSRFERHLQKEAMVVDTSKKEIWYIDMAKSLNAKVPKWFSMPQENLMAIGYGEGETLLQAKANARNDLAYMLKVRIDTSFIGTQKVSALESFKQTKEKTQHSSEVELDSSDYKLFKQDFVDGRWYVGLKYLK